MPTTLDCPGCGQRLELDCSEGSLVGTNLTCPTCATEFAVHGEVLHRTPLVQVAENTMSPRDSADSNKWRSIIQECRNCVPVIEGAGQLGAGLLISRNGFIITNAHVVDERRPLLVSLYDGTKVKALSVHRHQQADLAIIKASIRTEKFFQLATRLAVGYEAGDEVLAIGHPRGLSFTATRGIVSESRRSIPDGIFVQTDVAINPGNSGGPLLDNTGKLVGLNTQVRVDSQGLGFAIPAQQVFEYWQEFERLFRTGKLAVPSDEQLAGMEPAVAPTELIEEAARLAGLSISKCESKNGYMWEVTTQNGGFFTAWLNEKCFILRRMIVVFDSSHSEEARVLLQLLRWQYDMIMVRFEIDEDGQLSLRYARTFQNLGECELSLALAEMSNVVDSYVAQLEKDLEQM